MDLRQGREPLFVVPAEVGVEVLVGVDAQIFADDLDGQDLRVGELGGRVALAQLSSFKPIVDEAENGYDEGVKIHEKRRPPLRWLARSTTKRSGGLGICSTPQ